MVPQQPGHGDVGAGCGAVPELPAIAVLRVLVLEEAVQEGGVGGVDADFQRLQPVALPEAFEGEDMAAGRPETIEIGEVRRLVRAHIGEDDAVLLDDRI